MTKKKIFVIALAVCLVAILSLGSLAWFTAEDKVTNEFYVADTNTPDAEGVFGIDVWEYDEDGEKIAEDGDPEDGIVFEEIIAGDHLKKEPHFTNTGIHPMYVRATVTISGADVLKEAFGPDAYDWINPENMLEGTSVKWIHDKTTYDPATKELVHVFYYADILEEGADTSALFGYVNIPTGLTVDQAERLDNFDVVILGEAIQSKNLNVASAKEAFETYWEEATAQGGSYIIAESEVSGVVDTTATMDEATSINYVDVTWASEDGVDEAMITATANATNGVVFITGGDFTLQAGDYIVKTETPTFVVYVLAPITVNGQEVAKADLSQYFDLMSPGMVWPMYP